MRKKKFLVSVTEFTADQDIFKVLYLSQISNVEIVSIAVCCFASKKKKIKKKVFLYLAFRFSFKIDNISNAVHYR